MIGDTTEMRVTVTLTQRMLNYIRAGTSVDIFTEAAPDDVLRAHITRISPFLHPVTRTTEAEIDVAEHDGLLRPGMFVTVDVLYGESELAAIVPNSAVYRNPSDGREGVFVASLAQSGPDPEVAGLPARIDPLQPTGPVTVGFVPVDVVARGRLTSAIEGIEPGDWVVTVGHRLLENREAELAVIQPTPWEHILELQQMQSRDLLGIIRSKRDGSEIEELN